MTDNFMSIIYKQFLKSDRSIDQKESVMFRREQNTGFVYFEHESSGIKGIILDNANLVRISYTKDGKYTYYHRANKQEDGTWLVETFYLHNSGMYAYHAVQRTVLSKCDLFSPNEYDKRSFVSFNNILSEDDYGIMNGTRDKDNKVRIIAK
ncbi:MAG: hypothetical protein PHE54_04390 [Bacilli bacterium]|nr:hypothetical protein [Bacilli bacterium]